MPKFYFNGCSITAGHGFAHGETDDRIYTNLVAKNSINDASGGSSNLKIFLHSPVLCPNVMNTIILQELDIDNVIQRLLEGI